MNCLSFNAEKLSFGTPVHWKIAINYFSIFQNELDDGTNFRKGYRCNREHKAVLSYVDEIYCPTFLNAVNKL